MKSVQRGERVPMIGVWLLQVLIAMHARHCDILKSPNPHSIIHSWNLAAVSSTCGWVVENDAGWAFGAGVVGFALAHRSTPTETAWSEGQGIQPHQRRTYHISFIMSCRKISCYKAR